MAKDLSTRQEKILDFIREFIEENRFPPTIREIGERVGISSTSVVKYNLDALERKGEVDNPWAVAKAQFKQSHKKQGGRWVAKESNAMAHETIVMESEQGSVSVLTEAIEMNGETFEPNGNIAYVKATLCHSFPTVNSKGRTLTAATIANSFASLRFSLVDFEHRMARPRRPGPAAPL